MILGLVGMPAAVPAFAGDIVLYDNTTAESNQHGGILINEGYAVADSFILTDGAVVDGATFAVNMVTGDTLTSVNWEITTDAFGGTQLASGTATGLPNTFIDSYFGSQYLEESVSIPSLALASGTYWFALWNASTEDGRAGIWGESNGSSIAYQTGGGEVISETFQILGSEGPATVTPEPSSFLLLGSGMAGLAGMIRRKVRA